MTFRSRPLLDLAKDMDCKARIPNVCNWDSRTTISAHLPEALGTGHKQADWRIAWCCSACHDVIDRRVSSPFTRSQLMVFWEHAHNQTMDEIFEREWLTVAGHKRKDGSFKRLAKSLPRVKPDWKPAA